MLTASFKNALRLACISQLIVLTPIISTNAADSQEQEPSARQSDPAKEPVARGLGKDLRIGLKGVVLDVDGSAASDFDVQLNVKNRQGRTAHQVDVKRHLFKAWIPVQRNDWFYVEIIAQSKDGRKRATVGIGNRELHQAAVDGIRLQLVNADRLVTIKVMNDGVPVANAHVIAEPSGSSAIRRKTDATGKVTIALGADERLSQLTAWTDNQFIGGYSFSSKPRRDPLGRDFEIELENCRDQTVRFYNAKDNSPVADVAFHLVLGTGRPHYNFVAIPDSFPHCRMTTDRDGKAVCRWFPDWKTHGAYVEILDRQWATAVENSEWKVDDNGALVMPLKRRVPRQPIVGKVTSDKVDVSGLLVEIKSFQGEEERRSDHVYAFTDEGGNFSADCIPGATYTVCVNDGQLVSNMIDLIPFEPDTGKSNLAKLQVSEGTPIEIRVTYGNQRRPMRNQRVYVRQTHDFTWMEGGKKKSGQGARDFPVFTDERGIAYAMAPVGANLRVSVNAGDWRSADRKFTVQADKNPVIAFHRAIDEEREVKGRLLAPPNLNVELARAEIIFGSIDGETDEREEIEADKQGRFTFKTKAIQLGIFAYTKDGKAAGITKPDNLVGEIELWLNPTMDFHGRLIGKNKEPLANHPVRVNPRVSGILDVDKSFAASFDTKNFKTKTDESGNYTLKNLPTEFEMTLRAAPIDGSKYDAYLDKFHLVVGEERPRLISRLRSREPDDN